MNNKTINITSKTQMSLPETFSMKELEIQNPGVDYNTLYQRVQNLLKAGAIGLVGEVKTPVETPLFNDDGTQKTNPDGTSVMKLTYKKGRSEKFYKTLDLTEYLIKKAPKTKVKGRELVSALSVDSAENVSDGELSNNAEPETVSDAVITLNS